MFWGIDKGEFETGNIFNQDNVHAMHDVLKGSCDGIKLVVDLSNKQWRKEFIESKNLKERVQRLEGFYLTFPIFY